MHISTEKEDSLSIAPIRIALREIRIQE